MGKAGPKKQAAALVKQKGHYRPSRNGDEVADYGGLTWVHNTFPLPPDDFPPLAVQLWNKVLMIVCKIPGYVADLDLTQFEEYCINYAMIRSLRMRIVKPPKDFEPRLEWGNYHKLTARNDKLASDFGFTPSARTSVKLTQIQKQELIQRFEL